MNFRRWNDNGSALPLVLAFASVGMIIVTAYLAQQVRYNVRALRSPAALQAALNARSGVYRALEMLITESDPDTMETISAIDQIFRMGMFDDIDTSFQGGLSDTDTAETVLLYTGDSANTASVAVRAQNIYNKITSNSTVLNITRSVEALLGCSAPAGPDTVLILENELPVNGRVRGAVSRTVKKLDTLPAAPSSKSAEGRIRDFVSRINRQNIYGGDDTSSFALPLTIRNHGALAAIPDTVRSHLLLDGVFSDIVWKGGGRRITVYGDLQITGSFRLENMEFSAGGEVRILDNASAANVYIFSAQRIFIGGDAVFHGVAVTLGSINVYGGAEVKNRSTLIAAGSSTTKSKDTPSRYSILLSESSVFDGVAAALGSPGGIKTGADTKLSGILWAEKAFCHSGRLSGIIKAEYFSDCSNPDNDSASSPAKITENIFSGAIEPLPSIGDYKMPYFMGTPGIISWKEF